MRKEAEYIHVLKEFAKDVGAPAEVKDFCTNIGTSLHVLEAETQWANWAEQFVGIVKEATLKDLCCSGCLIVLWDYCMEWRVLIFQEAVSATWIKPSHRNPGDPSRHIELVSIWVV